MQREMLLLFFLTETMENRQRGGVQLRGFVLGKTYGAVLTLHGFMYDISNIKT